MDFFVFFCFSLLFRLIWFGDCSSTLLAIWNIQVRWVCIHWSADHLTLGLNVQPCNLPGGEVWQQIITVAQVQTTEQVMAQSWLFSWSFLWWKQKKGSKLIHINWLVSYHHLVVYARASLTFSLSPIFYLMLVNSRDGYSLSSLQSQKTKCRAQLFLFPDTAT